MRRRAVGAGRRSRQKGRRNRTEPGDGGRAISFSWPGACSVPWNPLQTRPQLLDPRMAFAESFREHPRGVLVMGAGRISPTLQFAEPAQAAFQQAAPEVVGWQGPFGTGQHLVQAGFGCIKIAIEPVSAGERSEEHESAIQSL